MKIFEQFKNCYMWIILIIIFFIVLFICYGEQTLEHFHPETEHQLHFSRPYTASDLTANILYDESCKTPDYKTSHINYWYIPMQEYFDEGMNIYTRADYTIPGINYMVPGATSEECFRKRMAESGDVRFSMEACEIPPKNLVSGTIINKSECPVRKSTIEPYY